MVFFLVFVIGGAAFNYMSATSWVKVAVILVLLPAAIAFIKRNVPREYNPERIPEDLMPSFNAFCECLRLGSERLELSWVAPLEPKSSASAVSPRAL